MPSVRLGKSSALRKLPDAPGVYFFRDGRSRILYIGRATSLRDRVRSYFGADVPEARGPLIERMRDAARSVSWQETDSVLEAIILEANLIKKHRPTFNTKEKDDTSFTYVVVTREKFPRVLAVRGRELASRFPAKSVRRMFGPFPQSGVFREAMKIVRKIFPFRDSCVPGAGRPCFNRQLGLCPGICTGEISERDYARTIRNLELFFSGKKRELIRSLERGMRAYAKQREFERASEAKRQIFALTHIRDVALVKDELRGAQGASPVNRIEAYDIAHTSGTDTVGVMVVVTGGEAAKGEYRTFRLHGETKGSDTAALAEVIERRLGHPEWPLPVLIVVDGGAAQRNTALRILGRYGYAIPVVGIVKDERHRPNRILGSRADTRGRENDILLANAEAHRFAVRRHDILRRKIR